MVMAQRSALLTLNSIWVQSQVKSFDQIIQKLPQGCPEFITQSLYPRHVNHQTNQPYNDFTEKVFLSIDSWQIALVGVPFLESLSHSFYRCHDLETRWPILKPAKWLQQKKCPELGTLPYIKIIFLLHFYYQQLIGIVVIVIG